MKLPRNFFKPLAIGAPAPLRELPLKLERMIHFVPPHVEKLRAKVPELIAQVDVVLGNLEDAIPADAKEAARAGFIAMAQANDFGATGLWTRINALNSPWVLDDIRDDRRAPSGRSSTSSCCRKSKAPGTFIISTSCWPSSKPSMPSASRSSFTPSLKRPKASTTSRRSRPRRRACTASVSARPISPPRGR